MKENLDMLNADTISIGQTQSSVRKNGRYFQSTISPKCDRVECSSEQFKVEFSPLRRYKEHFHLFNTLLFNVGYSAAGR